MKNPRALQPCSICEFNNYALYPPCGDLQECNNRQYGLNGYPAYSCHCNSTRPPLFPPHAHAWQCEQCNTLSATPHHHAGVTSTLKKIRLNQIEPIR